MSHSFWFIRMLKFTSMLAFSVSDTMFYKIIVFSGANLDNTDVLLSMKEEKAIRVISVTVRWMRTFFGLVWLALLSGPRVIEVLSERKKPFEARLLYLLLHEASLNILRRGTSIMDVVVENVFVLGSSWVNSVISGDIELIILISFAVEKFIVPLKLMKHKTHSELKLTIY